MYDDKDIRMGVSNPFSRADHIASYVKTLNNPESVRELIGFKYEQWDRNHLYFIDAATGSGKTEFILNVLLPYCAATGKRILYFVNRSLLKSQISQDYNLDYQNSITLMTYQELEKEIAGGICDKCLRYKSGICGSCSIPFRCDIIRENRKLNQYSYVVLDEVHYFVEDAMYNPNTILSFAFLTRWLFDTHNNDENLLSVIPIFMSATMTYFKSFLNDYLQNLHVINNEQGVNGIVQRKIEGANNILDCEVTYLFPKDYSYLDIVPFFDNSPEGIAKIIEENNQDGKKWMIFWNNIDKCLELKKKIKQSGVYTEDELFMLDRYTDGNDEKVKDIVDEKELKTTKVLITTSVIENGISLLDKELRNLIIIADSEEQLIQIIGRKRKEREVDSGEKVKAYLFIGDLSEMKKRLSKTKMILDIYYEMERKDSYYKMAPGVYNSYLVTDKIIKNKRYAEMVKTFVYTWRFGCFSIIDLSYCSIVSLQRRQDELEKIVALLENDAYAFYQLQREWLGLEKEDITNEAKEWRNNAKEELRVAFNSVEKVIYDSTEEFNNHVKIELIKPIYLKYYKNDSDEKLKKSINNKGASFKEEEFNELCEKFGIAGEYELIITDKGGRGGGKSFKILRKENAISLNGVVKIRD